MESGLPLIKVPITKVKNSQNFDHSTTIPTIYIIGSHENLHPLVFVLKGISLCTLFDAWQWAKQAAMAAAALPPRETST